MANNSIQLRQEYVEMLDEVYKNASLTSRLDGQNDLARQGANADELIIPKMDMQGLGKYDRNTGYVPGTVNLKYETKKCNYDRGRKFMVDAMDNQETADEAFGMLASEFIRTKVVPEQDAFRFATYAGIEGIGAATATLTTGEQVIKAIRAAKTGMMEEEVPLTDTFLFITPTLHGMISDLDTYKSKEALDGFAGIVDVPQNRFYTKVELNDGKTGGQEAGGFKKASVGGNEINFMIIHKPALIQFNKHVAPRSFPPAANQDADGWIYTYRMLGIADAYDNKKKGIYCHSVAGK